MGFLEKGREYAPIIVRIAMALVFLWFGLNQLLDPSSFFGYIPQEIYPHSQNIAHEHSLQGVHDLPLTPHIIVMGNGAFETILGLLLLLGLFTRVSSLLLSIHLAVIAFSLGYNDLFIRDLGLALVTFAVFLRGPDQWCLDKRLKKRKV